MLQQTTNRGRQGRAQSPAAPTPLSRPPGARFFRKVDLEQLPPLIVQTHMHLLLLEIETRDDQIISDLVEQRQVDPGVYTQLKQLKEAKKAMRRCSRCQRQMMRRFVPAEQLPTLQESERLMGREIKK